MNKTALTGSFSLGVALALAGCATVPLTTSASTATDAVAPKATAAPNWAHEGSDLKPDANVRFGVLSNGMRYALLHNATPPSSASLRLRIGAGSLNERDDQQGLAHFLEHMTLNETRHYPEGELLKVLERAGLKFGPDTNASTTFEQTVYMLDLPKADAPTVDTALTLMREVAGEATLAKGAIDSERNIILAEERTRATPQYRLAIGEIGYIFRDDLLARRIPIGTTEVIRTAPSERLVEFYNAYYRPERATLIAVGDFDVADMEAKVRARFSDWKGRGVPGADAPPAQIPKRDVGTRVLVEPGVPTRVSMSWVTPLDTRPDTSATRREGIVEQIGLQILNRRLERVAATTSPPPFIAAAAIRNRQGLRGEITQLIGVSQTGKWQLALAAIEQEQRRAVAYGFTQPELAREISNMRAGLVAAATGAGTRPSPTLAASLVDAVNEDFVFDTPADNLALFDAAIVGLTARQVSAATQALFAGAPQIFLASPAPVSTGDAAVLSAFDQSRATPVAALAVQQAKSWPYSDFGKPGAVVERREIAGTGATAVRFANGVRLTVKPTAFAKDEVLVTARVGRGQLGLTPTGPNTAWGIQGGGFAAGGLGKLTQEELQEVLTGKVANVGVGVDEDAFTLTGTTRPEDFATQMQLLAAYIRDPAFRPTGWDRLRSLNDTIHDQFETSPGGVLGRDLGTLIRSNDPRWATPTRAQMAAQTADDMRRTLADDLAGGPLEVIVVGDITVEEAVRQAAATFAALPARKAPGAVAGRAIRFPAAASVTRTHAGRADQALAFIAWPTTDYYANQRETRGLNVLAQVIQLRLNAEIREKQGAAYSPTALHDASDNVKGFGYMAALIEAPPAAVPGFYEEAMRIARDLRDRPVGADELQRARRPLVENLTKQRASSNGWWLTNLSGLQERPERVESIRVGLDQYAAVTAAELQQLARKYLIDAKTWKMTVSPQAK